MFQWILFSCKDNWISRVFGLSIKSRKTVSFEASSPAALLALFPFWSSHAWQAIRRSVRLPQWMGNIPDNTGSLIGLNHERTAWTWSQSPATIIFTMLHTKKERLLIFFVAFYRFICLSYVLHTALLTTVPPPTQHFHKKDRLSLAPLEHFCHICAHVSLNLRWWVGIQGCHRKQTANSKYFWQELLGEKAS